MAVDIDGMRYDEADFFEIKQPLHLPYMTDMADYERYDGQIEIDGVFYNCAMRRVYKDTLHILCLPDYNKMKLSNSKINYGKMSNDLPAGKSGHDKTAKKASNAGEYNCRVAVPQIQTLQEAEIIYSSNNIVFYSSGYNNTPWQPPQAG